MDSVSIPTVNEVGDNPSSFATKVQRKDTTSQEQLRQMMELDYSELHYSCSIPGTEQVESVEDRRFNNILLEGIHKNKLGNRVTPLSYSVCQTIENNV